MAFIARLDRTSDPAVRRGRTGSAGSQTDDDFVQRAYLDVLGRTVDADGRRFFVDQLAGGMSRADLLQSLAESDEATARAARPTLPSLRHARPRRYREVRTDDGVLVPVFTARRRRDYAWLETALLGNGYYERPGEWVLEDDADKQAMAALVAGFEPRSVVEIGCSSGAVLAHLVDAGVDAVGIDISTMARERAPDRVRDRIVLGAVEELDLGRRFDIALALDVLEHVRPARVGGLLDGIARLLEPDGLLIANIPAYGADDVFGEPFPIYLPSWRHDAERGRPFRDLLVDPEGYPLHGHLVWATASWWTAELRRHGYTRDAGLEADAQRVLTDHFEVAPARRSLFVLRARPPRRAIPPR